MSAGQTISAKPFIGREREIGLLDGLLAAAAERASATVMIGGVAGIGKSHLVQQFAQAARESHNHVLSGSCIQLGTGGIPYTPLIDALRRLVREYGVQTVRELGGPAYDELAKLIGDFTGTEQVNEPDPQLRVFGAVLRMLDHLGEQAPTVLIFEDLHWADPSTLDLVKYLVLAQTDQRALLVFTYRSDMQPNQPLARLLAEPTFFSRLQRVELPPFTIDELRSFLQASASEPVDQHLVTRCFKLSEGNAFFAEELVVAGVLRDSVTTRLPHLLSEIILARFRQLTEDAVLVMQTAATAGRRVSHSLLAVVCDLTAPRLNRALRECVDQHMLVPDEGGTYSFRHALLREAVYQDLLPGEQAALHASMASVLSRNEQMPLAVRVRASEGALAEDMTAAVELAYHWYQAGTYPMALSAAVRAGDAAVRVRAFGQADLQYGRALELWSQVDDPEALTSVTKERILASAADAARWAGQVDRALALLDRAIEQIDGEREPIRLGELYERCGIYQWEAGAHDASRRAYERADALLSDQPPAAVTARVLADLATADVHAGRFPTALERGERALEMARSVKAVAEEGRALTAVALARTMVHSDDRGLPLLHEAVRIAKEVDNLEDLYRAYGTLTVALEHIGRFDEAIRVALDELARARQHGWERTRGARLLANNASALLAQLGEWDQAADLVTEMLHEHPVQEMRYPRLTLAEIYVARGQYLAAEELLSGVLDGDPDPRFLRYLYACLAESAIWQRLPESARRLAVDGLDLSAGSADKQSLLRLCAVGLRAAGDVPPTTVVPEGASADDLWGRCRGAATDPPPSSVIEAYSKLCLAERERAGGAGTVALWTDAADAWNAVKHPYPAAYADWRTAEAAVGVRDIARATTAAQAAYATAVRLAAEPLLKQIEAVATYGRLDLTGDGGSAAAPKQPPPAAREANPFGLTKREREVLKHLCVGDKNIKIAADLKIKDTTVGVHVSRILTKLGVENRTQAAAKAYQLELC